MKKLLLVAAILILLTAIGGCAVDTSEKNTYKAKVLRVVDESYHDEAAGKYYRTQYLTLEMMEGPLLGNTYESDVFIDAANAADLALYRA